jgi:predicted lactoylglutathione lyase
VTKQEYVAEANKICKEGDRQLSQAAGTYFNQELGLKRNEQPSQEQLEMFAEDDAIAVIQDQIDRLRELEAPEADAEQLTTIYDTAQDDLDAAKDDPAVLTRGQPFQDTNRLAREYGLTACDD